MVNWGQMKVKVRFAMFVVLLAGISLAAQPLLAASTPRRIDGVPVKPGAENPWIVAVMIDSVPGARPQLGLGAASVVYETLAEGGVPRFMALYARQSVSRIGPVRSVRPYFADYAAEYRAAVAHAGGSPDGLKRIGLDQLHSINALRGKTAAAFFRVRGYADPHNLFTSGALLTRDLTRVGLTKRAPKYSAWTFTSDPPLAHRPSKGASLHVDFRSGSKFVVDYRYNRRKNAFERSTGGRVHRDGPRGSVLSPKNVLVLFVPKERLLDRKGRLGITITGRGKGILLKNGAAVTVRWKKSAPSHRTVLTTERGKPITLTRGATWIEVVPQGKRVQVR